MVEGHSLDDLGMLIAFAELKRVMKGTVEDKLDHKHLNKLTPFKDINPTAENISKYIYRSIKRNLGEVVKLKEVTVWESPEAGVTYRE